jgi:hypothetical protein
VHQLAGDRGRVKGPPKLAVRVADRHVALGRKGG